MTLVFDFLSAHRNAWASSPRRQLATEGTSTGAEASLIPTLIPTTPARASSGTTARDIYLNDTVRWANVPEAVWDTTLGGYPVLKKWLSYRDHAVLGRPLHEHEIDHFRDTARRLAALHLLGPQLDAAYRTAADA